MSIEPVKYWMDKFKLSMLLFFGYTSVLNALVTISCGRTK
jgi:hypothetical protein